MALIVLDASVLIAHVDQHDPSHAVAVAAFERHAGDELVLPASAYSESLVRPACEGRLDEVRRAVNLLALRIVAVDAEIAELAAVLRAKHTALRLPDALVLACGDALDADTVLTTDRRWRRFPRARVVET